MATSSLSTGISTTSILQTPQAVNDSYTFIEGTAADAGIVGSASIVLLNVMQNDLGGAAKTMYSVDDANNFNDGLNDALVSGNDLLVKDVQNTVTISAGGSLNDASFAGISTWETTALGGKFAIVNGQIAYNTSGVHGIIAGQNRTIDQLGAGQTLTDTLTYAIRLANGTLSLATVTISIVGTNDGPVLTADVSGPHNITEVAGVTGSAASDATVGSLAFADVDLSDTHSVSSGLVSATWSAGGTLPAGLTAALASALSTSVTAGAFSIRIVYSSPRRLTYTRTRRFPTSTSISASPITT